MVNKEEEKMSLCDISKVHEKMAKKSRKAEFLRLFYSNPQKLLKLIKNLYDDNSISQQIKVNYYLQNETKSELCFLIELCNLHKEGFVRVIGTKVLNSEVRFQKDNELLTRLGKSDESIELIKEMIDGNLEKEITPFLNDLSLSKSFKFKFFPIYHPYKKNVIFYACLVNDGTQDGESRGIVGECFRYCQEIILNTMRFDEQKRYHKKQKDILHTGITNLGLVDNFTALLPSIKQSTIEILNAERCNIYFIDGKNLVSRIWDHGISYDTYKKKRIRNVVIPVGVGLVGTVALTGASINCIDANTNPLYRKDLDAPTGLITRNVLCFPLVLYDRVYGVMEAVNKKCGYFFSGQDVSLSEYIGKIFAIQLYMSLIKKKNWNYISRRVLVDTLMLENETEIEEDDLKFILSCSADHKYGFVDYMFVPSSVPLQHNMCVCLHIFEDLDLLRKIEIYRSSFVRFLLNVKIRQKQFTFHGWQHAFNTLLFVYAIVKKEKILENGTISEMECFCMFLAALCHDMEYGGPVDPFMPASGTTLGSLYSSPGSVVQFYSVAQTVRLLADCAITDDFNLEKFKEFIIIFDSMVLDMDLGNHVSNRNEVKNLIEKKTILSSAKNRRHFFAILLTCSDISDFCKPWEYMEPQVARTSDEFYSNETTDCTGLIDFTELVANVKLKKLLLLINFIKNICEPAFSLLSTVLPRTDQCCETVEYNTRSLVAKKDKLIQSQTEQY